MGKMIKYAELLQFNFLLSLFAKSKVNVINNEFSKKAIIAVGLALKTHQVLIRFQTKKPENKIEIFLKRFNFFPSLPSRLFRTKRKGTNEKNIKNVNPGNQETPNNNPENKLK